MAEKVADILAGSNDEDLLYELYSCIREPANPEQALFWEAWEVSDFIANDGFEKLFEEEVPMAESAQLFVDIGFLEGMPIFQKVIDVVPGNLTSEGYTSAVAEHLRNNSDRLKELLNEYLDASEALLSAFGQYVRDHKEQFSSLMT
jgi:hypothetical protein